MAGFLSQIPGGLVVREWVSGELHRTAYGAAVGMVSAIIFRLVLLVSELAISIILYVVGWRRLREPAAAIEAELTRVGQPLEPSSRWPTACGAARRCDPSAATASVPLRQPIERSPELLRAHAVDRHSRLRRAREPGELASRTRRSGAGQRLRPGDHLRRRRLDRRLVGA